jgi:MFS family permease
VSVAALLRRRGFRDLLIGQTVSGLGDWMGTVAFMALALELTDSPTAVGGVLVLRLLPAALGGPLAARAVRRWDRRRTMLAMDVTRAVIIAAVSGRSRSAPGCSPQLPRSRSSTCSGVRWHSCSGSTPRPSSCRSCSSLD